MYQGLIFCYRYSVIELPEGWERGKTTDGKIYYIDRINEKTQWELPTASKFVF